MVQVVEAIYENGILRPLEKLVLKEQERVQVSVVPIAVTRAAEQNGESVLDPLSGLRVATGIPDLAEHFDDYRFGRRQP